MRLGGMSMRARRWWAAGLWLAAAALAGCQQTRGVSAGGEVLVAPPETAFVS